jgi:hypothetical protein
LSWDTNARPERRRYAWLQSFFSGEKMTWPYFPPGFFRKGEERCTVCPGKAEPVSADDSCIFGDRSSKEPGQADKGTAGVAGGCLFLVFFYGLR